MAKTKQELDAIRRYLNTLERLQKDEQTARDRMILERQDSNLELVAELEKEVNEHPELRFGQILFYMFSVDGKFDPDKIFNYEPSELNNIYKNNKEKWMKEKK